jgi:excisionase family DNA binding protein
MRNTLSTSKAARLIGVAIGSVAKWIDDGQLTAGRTPGGHRRITRENLIAFLERQKLPIPRELSPSLPRVLIVDDEESVAKWIAEGIKAERPDLETLIALDGFAAGEAVARSHPEVVILDLWMPGMDGFEVCRRIKSSPDSRNTYVIAITGHTAKQAEQKARQCGADAFLPKPLNMRPLLNLLQGAIKR